MLTIVSVKITRKSSIFHYFPTNFPYFIRNMLCEIFRFFRKCLHFSFQLSDNSTCMPIIVTVFQKYLQFYQISHVTLNFIMHIFCLFSRQDFSVQLGLSGNSLCIPGWPRTQKSTCLCHPSAGITGICHHRPAYHAYF